MKTFGNISAWTGLSRVHRSAVALLVLSALILLPTGVSARCSFINGTGPSNVTFNPPATITVPFTAAVGTVLYTSPLIGPAVVPEMKCKGTTNYGVTDMAGLTPGTAIDIYPTGIPGVGYMLTHGDLTNYLYPYPCCQLSSGTYTFGITTSLQLVKTGPIASGSTLPAGELGFWEFDKNKQPEIFTLGNPVTIIDPACSVNTTPINVTLPSISTSALAAVGSTAGGTGFVIALTCSAGATLAIQLDYAGAASGIPGVLTKTSGTSAGVGVQMLDANASPVTFGTVSPVGNTLTGQMNLQYYARYYRTAALTAGSLAASATFTLSYQ